MSIRTGTQLKADVTAALSALDTAISTPSVANVNAAIAAFEVVGVNGRDSRAITYVGTGCADAKPGAGPDFAEPAREAARELVFLRNSGSATSKTLRRFRSTLEQLRIHSRQPTTD